MKKLQLGATFKELWKNDVNHFRSDAFVSGVVAVGVSALWVKALTVTNNQDVAILTAVGISYLAFLGAGESVLDGASTFMRRLKERRAEQPLNAEALDTQEVKAPSSQSSLR